MLAPLKMASESSLLKNSRKAFRDYQQMFFVMSCFGINIPSYLMRNAMMIVDLSARKYRMLSVVANALRRS